MAAPVRLPVASVSKDEVSCCQGMSLPEENLQNGSD